jgi:hypothetical protein
MCSLTYYSCFLFILFNQFNMFVYFYYPLIKLEKKFDKKISKHDQVNVLSCEIKYLDLHLSFSFLSFIFRFC